MSQIIPPTPVDQPQTSFEWVDWYEKLRKVINTTEFFHNGLKGIQGGSSAERYHLTLSQYNTVVALGDINETIDDRVNDLLVAGTNVTLTYNDAAGTITIDASGGGGTTTRTTITAPADSNGSYTANVIDASATALSKVNCRLVLDTTLDQNGYEELADMEVFAIPNAGSIDFTLTKPGYFVGPFYVDYSLA